MDVTNPVKIAEAILKLANNKDEMRALAKHGRAYAEINFHIEVVADAYEKIYYQLLSEKNV